MEVETCALPKEVLRQSFTSLWFRRSLQRFLLGPITIRHFERLFGLGLCFVSVTIEKVRAWRESAASSLPYHKGVSGRDAGLQAYEDVFMASLETRKWAVTPAEKGAEMTTMPIIRNAYLWKAIMRATRNSYNAQEAGVGNGSVSRISFMSWTKKAQRVF